jgi:hypothetical protein
VAPLIVADITNNAGEPAASIILSTYLPDYTASHPSLKSFAVIALKSSKSHGSKYFQHVSFSATVMEAD